MSERGQTDRVALTHPIFWGALVVLVVNDHWLKGSELLPGWLTGKLSDFAGLVAAPILLSALLSAATRSRRAVAFVIVGGWFTAANLFAPVAAATSSVAAWVGLSWTFWVDPTDLVALAILPLAWQVASHREGRSAGRLGETLGLSLGLAACIASPPPEPSWTTDAFLYNGTGRDLQVSVRWVEARVDCAAIRGRFAETLPRDVFGPGILFNVGAEATLPLDRGLANPDVPPDPFMPPPLVETGHIGTCDAVMISAVGLPDTVVFWEGLTPSVIPDVVAGGDDELAVENGLHLLVDEPEAETIRIRRPPSGYFLAAPVEVYDGGASCHDYGTITGFDWSELPSWSGESVRLSMVRPTIDGCVSVSLESDIGTSHYDAFVCVPPEDFPFLVNSEVRIWNDGQRLRVVRDLRLDDGSVWRTGELVVARGVGSFNEGPFTVDLIDVDAACMGVREECGGFRVPAAGGLTMETTTRFVHPGDVVERDAADGRRARLRVGRAEQMWVTHPACGAGRNELGPRLEALVVYGEEPR